MEPPLHESPDWTFFTNHTHVLVCLRNRPGSTMREIAQAIGITERAVQRIVAELESSGVLVREREGRSNRYTIHAKTALRHPLERHRTIGEVLDLLSELKKPERTKRGE